MSLGNIMLAAVVLAALVYGGVVVFGLIAIWPYGALGLGVLLFFAAMLGAVVMQRAADREDRHYSRNVRE
jgi:membrane protein implicated in regulation of membrane protease activity